MFMTAGDRFLIVCRGLQRQKTATFAFQIGSGGGDAIAIRDELSQVSSIALFAFIRQKMRVVFVATT